MRPARTASIAFLALIFPVAALVFAQNTWAASGNIQVCHPNTSCTVGEFLYDDSYVSITAGATCSITSRYPDGSLLLNNVSMSASTEGDGWYAHTFTAPTTLGLYRTEVKCTVGSDTMALDKSFEVQTAPSTLTSNDVSSAVWSYSGRSLSTFGTLITDIWNNATRTLTGAGLSSGSLATKSNVDDAKTETSNITNIQNITNETRTLIEQVINKPIIENGIESGSVTFDLQSKIDNSKETAGQLNTKILYVKSKSSLIDSKWTSLNETEITDSVQTLSGLIGDREDRNKTSILGMTNWLKEEWNWPETEKIYTQASLIKINLASINTEVKSKGKTTSARDKLKNIISQADKLHTTVGNSDSLSSQTIHGRINEVLRLAQDIDTKSSQLDTLLSQFKPKNKNVQGRLDDLSKDVDSLNQLPKISKFILAKSESNEKDLKNKILQLKGVLDANKEFLARKPGSSFASTWLELGSIVFKTLITNPSQIISQTVPLKYYLPKEIKRENIVEIDQELTVNFDAEKDQYFVSGEFVLKPVESRTLSIVVDDKVFEISQEELELVRKQAEDLSKPLQNSSYFAQGTVLKSDIDSSLSKIISLQKNAATPEEKIRAYREAHIEYQAAKDKLEKLKDLVTSAGSVGTLFGFVGGAQALAVWGLIIVMAAGFVFLTLYLRSIRNSEIAVTESISQIKNGKRNEEEKPVHQDRKRPMRRFKIITAIFLVGMILSFIGGVALTARVYGNRAESGKNEPIANTANEEVLVGSIEEVQGAKSEEITGEKVRVFVPEDTSLSVHKEPNLNSPLITTLKASQAVFKIESSDGWVKIVIEDPEKLTGWIDGDFIDEVEEDAVEEESLSEQIKFVTVSETPTGFLRVRTGPWGEEIARVEPGKKFALFTSENGWSQIVLEDGSLGWVFDKYISASDVALGLD